MITATERALCLDELRDDEFMVIATRGFWEREWCYTLSPRDVKRFRDGVDHRDIISVQRREAAGSSTLLAKLAGVR